MSVRRKRAFCVLLTGLICAFGLIAISTADYLEKRPFLFSKSETVIGVMVMQNLDFLAGKEELTCEQNPGVCCEGVLLPYDSTGILYLAEGPGTLKERTLYSSLKGYSLYTTADPQWNYMEEAIRENDTFSLWLVGEKDYYQFDLVISGMPVISIQTSFSREQEEVDYETDPDKKFFGLETLYYGTVSLFNPGVNTERYEILESYVCYHVKGASSANLEKKSYSFKLQNGKGENVNESLLGMRADNLWKLNALYTDVNRVREITASKIWEQFDAANGAVNEAGPRMEYVELILDNCYQGIYCLVEPVDEDKLELDRNDVLYKVIDWAVPDDEQIQVSIDKKWRIQSPIRLRYPETITDYSLAWFPMRDYLNVFYRGNGTEYEDMLSLVNLDNLADMLMFLQTVSASDNSYKNTYYAAIVDTPGQYTMYQVPWDLDYTFGNQYKYGVYNNCEFHPDYTISYGEKAIYALLERNRDEVMAYLKDRWTAYRESFLSTEYILDLLTENRDYLVDTGAVLREQERWPEAGVDMNIEYLLEYQSRRMEWLDTFFGISP